MSWQSREVRDPRALRALAHPTRLALLGLIRREGPLTATRAGELVGESSGSASFHLRQLAKYGFVEDAGGGRGRERPWRATALATSWPNVLADPEASEAADELNRVVVEGYFEQVTRWLVESRDDPEEWREASTFGDAVLYLTAEELVDLRAEIDALVERRLERTARPEVRPEEARPITVIRLLFPAR